MRRAGFAAAIVGLLLVTAAAVPLRRADMPRRFLYVAAPGIRNYVEHGGIGILVFDIDAGYRFVRRIPTFDVPPGSAPENIKGIAAHAGTARLYLTTPLRVAAFDLTTDRLVWNRQYPGGADRLALSPDGRLLYVPSFEGPHWHAIDAATGDIVAKVVTESGAHNTIYGPDGRRVYLAGLKSSTLNIADPATHTISGRVGPFSQLDSPVHDQRGADTCLRQRQRPAGIRSRRHHDGPDAASRGSDGLPEGSGQAPRVPQPRHRPDAGRARDLAGRRRQQQAPRLRQHRDAAKADSQRAVARSAGLDHASAWTVATPIRQPARSSTSSPDASSRR